MRNRRRRYAGCLILSVSFLKFPPELFGKHVDLQKHTQLATIHLDDIHVKVDSVRSSSILSVIQCALASPYVEELVFSLRSFHTVFVDNLRWDHIDDILWSKQSLQHLVFCIYGWESLRDVQEALTIRLPRSSLRLASTFRVTVE